MVDGKLMQKIAADLQYLMDIPEDKSIYMDIIELWDDKDESVSYGISYKED